MAAILTCSDGRVVPEVVFDQPPGALFVVRLAGPVLSPEAVGSFELAAPRLAHPCLVVLGHTHCIAVRTALDEGSVRGRAYDVVRSIGPAVRGSASLDEAVARHVRSLCVEVPRRSGILASLRAVGAVLRLDTGTVEWLETLTGDRGDPGESPPVDCPGSAT